MRERCDTLPARHATYKGDKLAHLLGLITPQPEWRVLDITTAESEVASYLAPYVQSVVTLKLISPGSYGTQWPVPAQQAGNIIFGHVNDETLPFARASFDCVICWLTAHHLPNATTFVQEAARVLVPGGILVLSGLVTSGEPRIARYINTLNRLRDPSHVWASSLDDWETFLLSGEMAVTHSEVIEEEADFDEWATNAGIIGDDLTRLRVLIARAPSEVQSWLRPRQVGSRLVFTLTEGIVIGHRKPNLV